MSTSSGSSQNHLVCHCSLIAPVVTSWKDDNVGRRFYGCAIYPTDGYCTFFRWIDPPLCERSRNIIRGLLRRLNEKRNEAEHLLEVNLKLEEMISVIQVENEILVQEKTKLENKYRSLKVVNKELRNQINSLKMIFASVLIGILIAFFLLRFGWKLVGDVEQQKFKMLY